MKVLVIRFSSIGDIVLTTPVLRCFKKKYPEAEIHYLTKAQFHPILAANPYISKFYLLEDDLQPILDELKREKYDLVLDLHKSLRSRRVVHALGIKSITFRKLNLEKWLKVNFGINNLPKKHIVDRYFDALKPLDVENDGQGLDYYIWDKEVNDNLVQLGKSPYVAFVVGAKHATKRLPEEKILEICSHINQKIVLLGGKEEEELGQRLNEALPAQIINFCGKLSINESAYVIKNARKVIAHDTGLMHIAAAFKKPIISIWGNTVPAFGMYPYFGERNFNVESQSHIVEVEDLTCRPCSKLGYEKCPKGHFRCMSEHVSDKIADLVNH